MAIDLTPLTLITGLPGSGKSLFTLSTVADYAKREGRKVYYHGIPELTLEWEILDEPKNWHKLEKGSIIVIDESQSTFPPRSAGSPMPEHVSAANTLRHKGFNLVLITQHPMLIDNSIRKLVTRHYHVVRFYGFQKSTVHEFNQVRDNCDKSLKGSIANHFIYPKEVFTWYKSADMHTIKKRIPARLILIIVLPLLGIAAVWFFFHSVAAIQTNADEQKAKLLGIGPATETTTTQAPSASQGGSKAMTKEQWIVSQTPRIESFPASAPKYDEVTKPVYAPLPAACVDFKKKCTCYTQQATKMLVEESVCKQIVANGYFIDFENKPQPANMPQLSVVSTPPETRTQPPKS